MNETNVGFEVPWYLTRTMEQLPDTLWGGPEDPEFTRRVHPVLADWARVFDPRTDGSALLLGPTGIGKTAAANTLIRRFIEAEVAENRNSEFGEFETWMIGCEWRTACDLVRGHRQNPLGNPEARNTQEAVDANLLVIDEVGTEGKDGPELVKSVLVRRYLKRLPTIVTSGLALEQFMDQYGDGLTRQLTEPGRGVLVDLSKERWSFRVKHFDGRVEEMDVACQSKTSRSG